MLYTLNFNSVTCQLYLNKTGWKIDKYFGVKLNCVVPLENPVLRLHMDFPYDLGHFSQVQPEPNFGSPPNYLQGSTAGRRVFQSLARELCLVVTSS